MRKEFLAGLDFERDNPGAPSPNDSNQQFRLGRAKMKEFFNQGYDPRDPRIPEIHETILEQKRVLDKSGERVQPCHMCDFVAFCKDVQWTCEVFRAYVSNSVTSKKRRLPDTHWDESFPDDEIWNGAIT